MTGHLKAGLIGAIILFVWGFVSWMALPWHKMTMHDFSSDIAVTQIVQANATESGIYVLPSMKELANQHAQEVKPMIFMSVMLAPHTSMTKQMLISFITQFVAAFLVAWMLARTNHKLGYMGRVGFVLVFAFAACVIRDIPAWNWFGFDAQYTLFNIADTMIGWFLAGLVLAKFAGHSK